MTQLISELRTPPIVGEFYMVPVIRDYPYHGRTGTWPVIGPKHQDADFFNFPDEHYHVDARFLTNEQQRIIRGALWGGRYSVEAIVNGYPLMSRGSPLPKGRAGLARRKCSRESCTHAYRHQPSVMALRKHYGEPAEAIRLADGRKLCPHRKADISSFPIDAEGMVICPLHGLKVRCGAVT